jgi:hypothetical protein
MTDFDARPFLGCYAARVWELFTDVLGRPIGSTFKDRAVKENAVFFDSSTLEGETDRLFRNVGK